MQVSRKVIHTDLSTRESLSVCFDSTDEKDLTAYRYVIEAFSDKHSFEQTISHLEDICLRQLAEETLPPALTWILMYPNGSWTTLIGELPEDLPDGEYAIKMRHHLIEQRYGMDSHEALAVKILDLIHLMRTAIATDDMARAVAWAFQLGETAESKRFKRIWEPHVVLGKDTRSRASKGGK